MDKPAITGRPQQVHGRSGQIYTVTWRQVRGKTAAGDHRQVFSSAAIKNTLNAEAELCRETFSQTKILYNYRFYETYKDTFEDITFFFSKSSYSLSQGNFDR